MSNIKTDLRGLINGRTRSGEHFDLEVGRKWRIRVALVMATLDVGQIFAAQMLQAILNFRRFIIVCKKLVWVYFFLFILTLPKTTWHNIKTIRSGDESILEIFPGLDCPLALSSYLISPSIKRVLWSSILEGTVAERSLTGDFERERTRARSLTRDMAVRLIGGERGRVWKSTSLLVALLAGSDKLAWRSGSFCVAEGVLA